MIARHGISGLRVEEVAAEAGVSTALLYYHFHSRAGLVEAAFEMASERAPSTALRVASDGRSGYEALEGALLAELDPKPSVRAYAIVWGEATTRAVFDDELRPRVRALTHAWGQTVAGAIARGIEDGSISADVVPEDAADVLIGLVDGFSARWLSGSLELERAQDLLRIAVRQLRA
jgi:AcrR family transcriptional regulator